MLYTPGWWKRPISESVCQRKLQAMNGAFSRKTIFSVEVNDWGTRLSKPFGVDVSVFWVLGGWHIATGFDHCPLSF